MLHRTNIPTVPTLQKMCDAFEITLSDFFLEGIKEYTLTNSQTELLEIYKNLSKDDRRMLIAYAKGLAKLLDAPKK